jgi:hypothetical protein
MFTSVTPHPVIPADRERSALARLWHQLGPGSRERHLRSRTEAQRLALLRAQWVEACHHVGLGLMIYTPGGVGISVPRIARADFGPPLSFTVRLRPGQKAADITAVARRLALALGVPGLRATDQAVGWATVVVVDPLAGSAPGDDGGCGDGGPDDLPPAPRLRVA